MSANASRYLGPIPRPAVGIRIPDIFLNGILSAYKLRRTAGGLMLSCTREAAPQYVIDAPPGKYPITLGHTGVPIKEYMVKGAEAVRKTRTFVEIEADHLIVGSYLQAVQRILGESGLVEMTDEEISKSVAFVKDAIDEATGTGFVNAFTVDTTSLIDLKVENYSKDDLGAKFHSKFPNGKDLIKEYSNEFCFSWIDGSLHRVKFSEEEIMAVALQFQRSLEVCYEIYSHLRTKMGEKPFGFEIALDEFTRTTGKELVYYLREWKKLGAHVDFVAPNLGFRKRADFDGDLRMLKAQLSFLAAVANGHGALLSIHSGSGKTPYSGKGKGVYETMVEATGGRIKYKISGVYFELLMDLLAKSKPDRHRKLFQRIFDDVNHFLEDQVDRNAPFADATLRKMFLDYKQVLETGRIRMRDSRSELFRHYSFVALNLRDSAGRRYLRDELLGLYEKDSRLRRLVDEQVKELTLRLIDGLNFKNNITQMACSLR